MHIGLVQHAGLNRSIGKAIAFSGNDTVESSLEEFQALGGMSVEKAAQKAIDRSKDINRPVILIHNNVRVIIQPDSKLSAVVKECRRRSREQENQRRRENGETTSPLLRALKAAFSELQQREGPEAEFERLQLKEAHEPTNRFVRAWSAILSEFGW